MVIFEMLKEITKQTEYGNTTCKRLGSRNIIPS